MEDSSRSSCKELPEDCWELILSRLAIDHDNSDLEPPSLVCGKSPPLVCKQFLSITNRLQRKLVVDKGGEPFCGALQRFPNLKEIKVYQDHRPWDWGKVDVNPPLLKIAFSGLDLRALQRFTFPRSPSPNCWRKLGSTLNNLKTLRINYFKSLRDTDLVHIADAFPGLEELNIVHPRYEQAYRWGSVYPRLSKRIVTDAGIEVISRKLTGLLKIDISGNRWGCSDPSLIALSSNCVRLQEIRCTGCRTTNHGICFVLTHSSNLISLQVDCGFSSPDLSFTFPDAKNYGRTLRELDLCAYVDQDQLLCSIAKAMIPLEKLILRHHNDLSLHGLSTLLCACPSLKHLKLYINSVNDDSMRDLCRYLPNLLSIVLFGGSNLTIATFFILAEACPALSEIELVSESIFLDYRSGSLDLGNQWYVNDELLKKVMVTCPNLHTLNIRGCHDLTKEGTQEVFKCCSQIKRLVLPKCMQVLSETFNSLQIEVDYR